ncbi:MAG: LysR family transcriptional regulator [Eubacteriales bacterium]|nr:LysR family transcriptional regulator [Eubacteriales bacterium]
MDTKYLRTLQTILETGSFQKAALQLNYTQSTVTFHIQQLEQECSVKLFDKIGRKMILTQAGRDLLPHMETILQETEWMHNYGKSLHDMSGTLRVGMPDALLCYQMQPLLRAFQKQAPNIQLTIQSLHCYAIRESVINGGIDMGIHCNIGGYPKSIVEESITSYHAILVASPTAGPQQLDFITPHQRKSINLIYNDPHSLHQKRLTQYLEKKDIVMHSDIEMWSIEAAKVSVMNNLGIAYLPDFTIQKELHDGTLIPIKTELDTISVPVVCTYHKNKWITPAMALFRNLLHQGLAKQT